MGKLSLKPKTFCWFFSVQAGVVFISTIILTLCVIIAVYNISAPNCGGGASSIISHLFVYLWCGLMVICLTLALLSVFTERRDLLVWSFRLLIAGTAFWGIVTVLSFINSRDLNDHVCLGCRCGEHLWLLDARWRRCSARCERERGIGAVSYEYGPSEVESGVDLKRRPAVRRSLDNGEEGRAFEYEEDEGLHEEEYEEAPSYQENYEADFVPTRGAGSRLRPVPPPGPPPVPAPDSPSRHVRKSDAYPPLQWRNDFDVYDRDEDEWIRSQKASATTYCGLQIWSYILFFAFLAFLIYSILIFASQKDNMLGIL